MLKSLFFDNNLLNSLPNLSGLINLNQDFHLYNNALDFGDLQSVNVNWANIANKKYNPQANLKLQVTHDVTQITLEAMVDGTNNSCKWYKNDTEITGETGKTLIITDLTQNAYYCEVTNTDFPDLTLKSESVLLPAGVSKTEYDALVALYNATGGENWTNSTNWLSEKPASEWYGVDIINIHVSNINLNDNNLGGTIPLQIGDLKNLTHLGLSGNSLNGEVPSEIAQLENVLNLILFNNELSGLPDLSALKKIQTISVGGNKLTFEDIEPNIGLASLEFDYSPQATIGSKEKHVLVEGENDTLVINVGGEHNIYKWYKDGNEISASNNDTLIVEGFSTTDAGEYFCEINNTMATDLTLKSDTFALTQAFSVTFNVSDKNGNVEGAIVYLNSNGNETTDVNGKAVFERIEQERDLSYTIDANNHDNYTGTIDIVDQNIQLDVNLTITGINNLDENLIQIFPNPSNGNININLDKKPGKNLQLKIIDLAGKTVYNKKLDNLQTHINLESKQKGTYILQILDNEKVYSNYKILLIK